MNLTLIDQLTLLALDDKKGTFIPDSTSFAYAIAGAIILELALKGKIEITDNRAKVKETSKTGDKVLDTYFDLIIQSNRERKIKTWIEKLGEKAKQVKKDTLEKLIENRILVKKQEKFLWVFTYNKYPAQNSKPEYQLKDRLHHIILHDHRPELKEIMLLNLIESCGLGKEVFGKENAKNFKKKVKHINEYDQLAGSVNKSIKEVCDAVNTMLVVLMATAVTTTTISS